MNTMNEYPSLEEAGSWIYEIGVGCKRKERQQLGAAVTERHMPDTLIILVGWVRGVEQ